MLIFFQISAIVLMFVHLILEFLLDKTNFYAGEERQMRFALIITCILIIIFEILSIIFKIPLGKEIVSNAIIAFLWMFIAWLQINVFKSL